MSITYPDKPNTQFPDAYDNFDRMIDITISMLPFAKQYQSYYNSGNLNAANQILVDHPELKQALVSADNLNKLFDSINAIEQFYMTDIQNYLVNIVKPKGTWSNTTKYSKYDVVQYSIDGAIQSYMCISTNCPINALPTDINYWTCITLRGEQGISGTGLTPRGYWNAISNYYKDDLVAYNNVWWASNGDNINQEPNESSSSWTKMLDVNGGLITYNNTESHLKSNNIQDAIDEVVEKIDIESVALNSKIDAVENIFSDAYDPTKTYITGDLCIHEDILYKCTVPINTPEEWNIDHWIKTSIVNEINYVKSSLGTQVIYELDGDTLNIITI